MRALRMILVGIVPAVFGCGDDGGSDVCGGFEAPEHSAPTECAQPDPENPQALVECLKGSGHLGQWTVDGDGLPAFDFQVEHRCDDVALAFSPRPEAERDPIHLVGNGRGMVAMAHASGAVEIYSQDRGHKWLNKLDTWKDPENPDFPPQLAGGFNYLVVDGKVRSTRYDDLPVKDALSRQTRRFGVGYYETVTTFDDVRVTRRVFAPDTEARALIAEVTLENLTDTYVKVGLVEMWDLNEHQVSEELATSDLLNPEVTHQIQRRRRAVNDDRTQILSYDKDARILLARTTANSLPDGVTDRTSVAKIDYFPDPVYLAPIDAAEVPDAVWLEDDELWGDSTSRTPPKQVARDGEAESRSVELEGAGQGGVLALRVQLSVPTNNTITRRFAIGYVPGGGDPDNAVAELRGSVGEIRQETIESWQERMAWVAVADAPDAGVIQRELAWSSYYAQAHATFDEARASRVLGQGGAYKYIHGLDGAIGDLAIFAEGLTFLDPELAASTLLYALSTQHGQNSDTPWRYPYATTGVHDFSDVVIYNQRSDAYFLIPAAIGRYIAASRDFEFLMAKAFYWPATDEEQGSVLDHLSRTLDYAVNELGLGARGLVAMGTGDYADGVLSMTEEETSPQGTSSVFNAGIIVHGFPLLAELLSVSEPDLGNAYRDLLNTQADAVENQAFSGEFYYRAFVDNGDPLAPNFLFLEPQLFPILAGLVDDERRDALLDLIADKLETPIGAMSVTAVGDAATTGDDAPLVGGIWPVANAWLTEAYALRDLDEAWDSLVRNTMATHAQEYPSLWYGIWTGPDSFNGPASDRPGEADAHLATALTDYPALNTHLHLGPLRGLVALLGIEMHASSWTISPRLPSESYSVVLPYLELHGTPTSLRGVIKASGDDSLTLTVRLPSGARESGLVVKVKDLAVESTRPDTETVVFTVPLRRGEPVAWSVVAL